MDFDLLQEFWVVLMRFQRFTDFFCIRCYQFVLVYSLFVLCSYSVWQFLVVQGLFPFVGWYALVVPAGKVCFIVVVLCWVLGSRYFQMSQVWKFLFVEFEVAEFVLRLLKLWTKQWIMLPCWSCWKMNFSSSLQKCCWRLAPAKCAWKLLKICFDV